MNCSETIGWHASLVSSVGDASQLPLASELLVQHLELVDELLAYRRKHVARRNGSVSLDPNVKLGDIRMSDCCVSVSFAPLVSVEIETYSCIRPCRRWGAP